MKTKIKTKTETCQVPGCKKTVFVWWQPKGKFEKRLHVCKEHISDDRLWELVGMKKPEKVIRPKPVIKNHKPKKEGKAKWQEILDNWLAKGKYPVSNFMNFKRWEYWISIGGKKPEGESRKIDKAETSDLDKPSKTKKTTTTRKKDY